MELRDYANVLRKNWVPVLIMAILGLGAGAGVSALLPPEYESRTQLYVSARADTGDPWELMQGADYSSQVVNSYVNIVTSGLVLEPVIDRLGLDMEVSELEEDIFAESPSESVLINITAIGSSPVQAANIADAVGESLKQAVQSELEPEIDGPSLVSLTTTQEATLPESPTQPKIVLNLVLGLIIGLALGYGIALVRRMTDTRIQSTQDVEAITDIPVIGEIVEDPEIGDHRVIAHARPWSPRAESFRALRTSLQYLNIGSQDGSYVITSVNPGEGKSTTVLNLAAILAQDGAKVIVVDGDLRLPSIADYLDIEGGAGLTGVLIGSAELDDVVQRWGESEMYILPAGRIPPNPSELLGSEEMKLVLDRLKEQYDYVLFDSPPVRAVTDAEVLSKLAGGVLVVVAAGLTKQPDMADSLRGLHSNGITPLGLIMTHLPVKDSGRYHYHSNYSETSATKRRKGRRRRRGELKNER